MKTLTRIIHGRVESSKGHTSYVGCVFTSAIISLNIHKCVLWLDFVKRLSLILILFSDFHSHTPQASNKKRPEVNYIGFYLQCKYVLAFVFVHAALDVALALGTTLANFVRTVLGVQDTTWQRCFLAKKFYGVLFSLPSAGYSQ